MSIILKNYHVCIKSSDGKTVLFDGLVEDICIACAITQASKQIPTTFEVDDCIVDCWRSDI